MCVQKIQETIARRLQAGKREKGDYVIGEICELQSKLSFVCSKQKGKKEGKGEKENQAAMVGILEQRKRRHGVSSS